MIVKIEICSIYWKDDVCSAEAEEICVTVIGLTWGDTIGNSAAIKDTIYLKTSNPANTTVQAAD